MGEVGAGGAVAVPIEQILLERQRKGEKRGNCLPEVVVEEVGACFVGFVAQHYAGTAVVGVRDGGVHDEFLLGAMFQVRGLLGSSVSIIVCDQDVFVSVRG